MNGFRASEIPLRSAGSPLGEEARFVGWASIAAVWSALVWWHAVQAARTRPILQGARASLWLLVVAAVALPAAAQDDPPSGPLGVRVAIDGTVDDMISRDVRNAALKIQSQAAREDRRAFLLLEISTGPSKFGQVRELAKFLESDQIRRVNTIAWVRGELVGNNVVLALACREIVLSSDSAIGDIAHYEPLLEDEQLAVRTIADQNGNPLVGATLARAMMERELRVLKMRIEGQQGARIVTEQEWEKESAGNVAIPASTTLKEAGERGLFTAEICRSQQVIATHIADSVDELSGLYGVPFENAAAPGGQTGQIKARQIQISGMIEPSMESFVIRQIENAVASGVNLLVFEIDSPGGFVTSSERIALTIGELNPDVIRTVAYVPANAISGAAMVAFGCDEIYMRPTAQIGDAGPIEIRPGQAFEHADVKILSKVRTLMRSLAELKNRPPALLEAMADRNLIVYQVTDPKTGQVWYLTEQELVDSEKQWIRGPVVPESREDNLLTVSGNRAVELGLALRTVQDYEDFKAQVGVVGELKRVEPTWVDTLVYVLNSRVAMFFLLVGGILFLYLEVHFFTGMMGILSALCFSLFFWARFLNGTAGMLEIILFLLGLGCIVMEIFVIPGFGVFGVSGGLMVIASIVMASQSFHGLGTEQDLPALSRNLGTIGASIVAVIGLASVLNRFLPQMPLLRGMVLAPPVQVPEADEEEPRLDPTLLGRSSSGDGSPLLGRQGLTQSILRPAGKARIDDRLFDVVSTGPFIAKGVRVEVVHVEGNRVVVRPVDSAHA